MNTVKKIAALAIGSTTLALTAVAGTGAAQAASGPTHTSALVERGQPTRDARAPAGSPAILEFSAPFTFAKGASYGSGSTSLQFQQDGDLVLTDQNATGTWSTDTSGRGDTAVFRADGDLVVFDAAGNALWESGTAGANGATLRLGSDGSLAIYATNGQALWVTNANH